MPLGVDSLKNNLTNPARSYLWDVIFPTPLGGGDTETLMIRCQSSTLPGLSFGEIKVPYKQTAGVKYHGKVQMSQSWDLSFMEGEDKAIFTEFYTWAKLVVDPKTGIGTNDPDIKTDVLLSMLTTQGTEYMKIKLRGAWIQAIKDVTLDYGTEEAIKLNITIAYDYWEQIA